MSRKGNLVIELKDGVSLNREGDLVTVTGPKGEQSVDVSSDFEVSVEENLVRVLNHSKKKNSAAFHGLYQSLLAGAVEGVTSGFQIELELFGVGYRVQKKGNGLNLSLGFSHPVEVDGVDGVDFVVEGSTIIIKGINKQKVGQVAADIIKHRDARKDPYKQKGVRYKGAILRKKAGKKVK